MSKKEEFAVRLMFWLILFLLPESDSREKLKALATSFAVNGVDG